MTATPNDDAYRSESVEAKWQRFWEEHGTTQTELDAADRPYFNLMMYPYPSAEGLHVGNLYAFTGADINGRYRRLTIRWSSSRGTSRTSSVSSDVPA
ncbi:MAG: hypothetical protein P8Y07_10925 [Gemmatimonadales bacterium]